MAAASILEIVRAALRRSSTSLDATELTPLIEAAKSDLSAAGVGTVDDTDPLTQAAIRLFVLYQIERDEKQKAFYEQIKNGMAINSDYEAVVTDA